MGQGWLKAAKANQYHSALSFLLNTFWPIAEEEFLSVRLTGGLSSNQGYLELYHNGQWGTICPDDWEETASSVVCRELGFLGHNITLRVIDSYSGIFGQVQSHLVFASVRCRGDEARISDCELTPGSGSVYCITYSAVGIICQEGTSS